MLHELEEEEGIFEDDEAPEGLEQDEEEADCLLEEEEDGVVPVLVLLCCDGGRVQLELL